MKSLVPPAKGDKIVSLSFWRYILLVSECKSNWKLGIPSKGPGGEELKPLHLYVCCQWLRNFQLPTWLSIIDKEQDWVFGDAPSCAWCIGKKCVESHLTPFVKSKLKLSQMDGPDEILGQMSEKVNWPSRLFKSPFLAFTGRGCVNSSFGFWFVIVNQLPRVILKLKSCRQNPTLENWRGVQRK